jgi:geranylgeranyl diphosphate synthase type I
MTDPQQAAHAGGAQTTMPECLQRHRTLVDDALHVAVDRLPPTVRSAAAYHFGWRDADGKPVESNGGKAIRPAITLLAAEACGAEPEAALVGAVALELVHDFSLIHDDLMDGDAERRHRPTVWAIFGAGQAIVTGDALLALAQQLLLEDGRSQGPAALELCRAIAGMLEGQAQDLAFETRLDVTVDEGVHMSSLKTGALLACAGALGALLAKAGDARVAALRAYGRDVGIAFQAVDDILGIWGEPEVTGKPMASDLRQRKKTLPILYALESGGATARELRALLASDEIADDDLLNAVRLLESAGSRAWALELASQYLGDALAHLEGADLRPGPAHDLRAAAEFIVRRDF